MFLEVHNEVLELVPGGRGEHKDKRRVVRNQHFMCLLLKNKDFERVRSVSGAIFLLDKIQVGAPLTSLT